MLITSLRLAKQARAKDVHNSWRANFPAIVVESQLYKTRETRPGKRKCYIYDLSVAYFNRTYSRSKRTCNSYEILVV